MLAGHNQVIDLLNQGETFTKVEATRVIFAVTKLFQSNDAGLFNDQRAFSIIR